jgi:hypothetical protein
MNTCEWLVQVPTGNPEPDSEADLWTEEECGAPIVATAHDGQSWRCAAGHEYVSYVASEDGRIPAEWVAVR